MKKILVFGTFDGIHEGHLDFFKQAKEYGNYLVVVVGRDETVRKIKGQYPKKSENERLEDVKKQALIDEVKLGNLNDPYKIIEEVWPDIICLGYDQKSFTEDLVLELKKRNLKTKIVRLKEHKPETYHSSKFNKKINLFYDGY